MRKLTISPRYFTAFLIILIFSNALFAQFEKYSEAAKWEYYSISDKKVSFLMPRLPVMIDQSNQCSGESTQNYAAYHDGIVFVFRVTSKIGASYFCPQAVKFSEESLKERIKTVQDQWKDQSNSANNISKDSVIKIVSKGRVIKFINDYENKRWFELQAYGADENNELVKNFLDSLKTDATGIKIGKGAEQVFGDDETKNVVQVKTTGKDEKGNEIQSTVSQLIVPTSDTSTVGVGIILKPRANYAEDARQNRVAGKVAIRVTFLANGGIGDVSVISGLPQGLTEEAIKAARKIVFVPAQRDGKRYSVTKPVEYSFSIY